MQYEWYQACQCVCVECAIVLDSARGGGSGHMRLYEATKSNHTPSCSQNLDSISASN